MMTDEECLAAVRELVGKRVDLSADAFEFFELICFAQVAHRHPRVSAQQKRRMRNYVERFVPMFIALGGPGIGQFIEKGWEETGT